MHSKANCKRSRAGLTLIELLVAVAIVGLIFAVSVTGLRTVFDVDLKKSSRQIASTLRYLRNKAITDHLYLRIFFDLGGQSYRIEEGVEPFVISTQEEVVAAPEKKKETTEGEETQEETDKEEAEGGIESSFTPAESKLLQPTKLPSRVFFKDIFVSYLSQKREQGEVTLYFFPDGYATAAVINLRDEEDEDHYSIELFSLSPRVTVKGEYQELPSEEEKK